MINIYEAINGAILTATNRAAKSALSAVSRDIREHYAIKKSQIDRYSYIIKANTSRDYAVVVFTSNDKGIPLYGFSARQGLRGVTASIKRGERKLYRSARAGSFIQKMPSSGHTGVFIRTGEERIMKRGRYKGKRREAIEELFGPEAMRIFKSQKSFDVVQEEFAVKAEQILMQYLTFRLREQEFA